ncbi:MAG: type IV secretion system DNA-binding domain-containing protein [Verrucomicrobiota bacterium]|nr:type IV secretion system DNA-binding domain-containing protein [Verrucomicrobiota bacterium]
MNLLIWLVSFTASGHELKIVPVAAQFCRGNAVILLSMNVLSCITAVLSLLTAAFVFTSFSRPYSIGGATFFGGFAIYAIWTGRGVGRCKRQIIARLKGLVWTQEDFCRGWLITGDTGSGKTRSGINQLLFQVFSNGGKWGGLCIDDKGVYWETLVGMARHFKRENDLILLQVRPDNPPDRWKPTHTFNLLSDRTIPFTTYAKFVVDTATSLGQRNDQSFFKNQAQTHIAYGLEMLAQTGMDVALDNVQALLLNEEYLDIALNQLAAADSNERGRDLIEHFTKRYREQPPEQMGGVKETIANYLQYFLTPDISEVFCAYKSTFGFHEIDAGKIICVAMPQKYQAERRYVNTFLKMLFYTHVLRRFDKPQEERERDNLLILWADEAQRFVTASDEGMSDYNCIDVMREAKATLVAAAQSSTSFIPPLGAEKANVLTLNLRNRMIFKAADEAGAIQSADFLGQKKIKKPTYGYSGGMHTRTYTEMEEHKIKPYLLRQLCKHQCVLVHCEKGYKKLVLPPMEPDGTTSKWFRPSII